MDMRSTGSSVAFAAKEPFEDPKDMYDEFAETTFEKEYTGNQTNQSASRFVLNSSEIKYLEAGMGNADAMQRVVLEGFAPYGAMPMGIVGKEFSALNVISALPNIAKILANRPAAITITNIPFMDAPWLTVSEEDIANKNVAWDEVKIEGRSEADIEQQLRAYSEFFHKSYAAKKKVIFTVSCKEHKDLLDGVIPRGMNVEAGFDFINVGQAWRLPDSQEVIERIARTILRPNLQALRPGGIMTVSYASFNDTAEEIGRRLIPGRQFPIVAARTFFVATLAEIAKPSKNGALSALNVDEFSLQNIRLSEYGMRPGYSESELIRHLENAVLYVGHFAKNEVQEVRLNDRSFNTVKAKIDSGERIFFGNTICEFRRKPLTLHK